MILHYIFLYAKILKIFIYLRYITTQKSICQHFG